MVLTQKITKEVIEMIKIDDHVKRAEEILSEEPKLCIDTRLLTEQEINRIFKTFIVQLFENTVLTDHPVLVYKYPIDRRCNMKEAQSLLEDRIVDYFAGNFYALPSIKISDDFTVVIQSMITNNFISVIDKKLVRELSEFLMNHRDSLKNQKILKFSYLEKFKNQMPEYLRTRKMMIINQLKELGYKAETPSDYVITIGIL